MFTSMFIRLRVVLPVLCLVLLALSACSAPLAGSSSSASDLSSPPAASAPSLTPDETIALPYTADYLLFQDGVDKNGFPMYGLADKQRKVLLPAKYSDIAVSEAGLIFTSFPDGDNRSCQIFRADGSQIGPDYSWISYASTDPEGNEGTFLASTLGQRPVPPYAAQVIDADRASRCWILGEDGQPNDPEPYEDIWMDQDGSIAVCRDGSRFVFNVDGTVDTQKGGVVETYFDGKYQIKCFFQGAWDYASYGLLDKDGNELAPPEYCKIDVPFEDRYVLYKGWTQTIDGAQAFLHNDAGTLLADDSNLFGFFTTPDSGYIGVSMVGSVFDGGIWSPESMRIFDASGNPEQHGYYFVDRDGKRLGERYVYIDFFANEAAQKASVAYTTAGGSGASEPTIGNIALTTPVADAYFLAIKQDGSQVKLPLAEKLIK